MNVGDVLRLAGVAPAELDEAVRQSRHVVRQVSHGAKLLARAFDQVGQRAAPGSKHQAVALVGSMWLNRIGQGADEMLRARPRGSR